MLEVPTAVIGILIHLLYIVRDDYLINTTVDCFSVKDNTELVDGYFKKI